MGISQLFESNLAVVNMGLKSFAQDLKATGTRVTHVDFRPGAPIAPEAARMIAERGKVIDAANARALERILKGHPQLTGMALAKEVIPDMRPNLLLHAGPPIDWPRMCGPMRGAVIGALMYEGIAETPSEAEHLAASGRIAFAPCRSHGACGPMAGIISFSMPVFIVENSSYGNRSFATLNEGLGKVLRYGAFGPEVIQKLKWMAQTLYPALKKTLALSGPIDLRSIIAGALHMGDEVHNRNRAATSLLYRALAPHIVQAVETKETAAAVLNFIHGNDHFFLNLAMAAAKATLDAARDIAASSVVTVMARNGTDFGVQLSGTGQSWFTGPAPVPDALFFPGYGREDANPDIGDSAITETAGLGGFAIAAAPAIVQFVGGSAADALAYTHAMYEICVGESDVYQIPYLDFRGTPTGIDAIKVVEKNLTPFIDTGVAHKNPGVGQVGAGVVSAPITPFQKAVEGLCETMAKQPSQTH